MSDRDPEAHVVRIGLRDLYDQLQMISSGYSSLSAKLDTALLSQTMMQQTITQQMQDVEQDIRDHETRLRVQEQRHVITPRNMWLGVGVIVGAVSALFTILTLLLK